MENQNITKFPRYERYKDSRVDWVGEIPEHWEILPIKRALKNFANGFWGTDPNGEDDLIVLRVADFDRNTLTISDKNLTYRAIKKQDRVNRLLKEGDILLEKSGGGDKTLVGVNVFFDKKYSAITSNFIMKMTPHRYFNSKYINYVFATLYANNINYRSIKQTTGIQNLDTNSYLLEKITIPPLPEQTAIAQFLDHKTAQIDRAIAIKEAQIKLLNERKQIMIQEAVTKGLDPSVPMKDSGVEWIGEIPAHWEVLPGLRFFSENKIKNTGMIETQVLSLSYGRIIIKPIEKLTGLVPESFETYQVVFPNYIVIRGTDLQNDKTSLRVGFVEDKGIITSAYLALQVLGNNNPKYLYLFLHTLDITKAIYKYGSGLRQNLSFDDFKKLPILNIPLEEQNEIVAYIEAYSKQTNLGIDSLKDQIQTLKEYKTTLINEAVTGKIKVY